MNSKLTLAEMQTIGCLGYGAIWNKSKPTPQRHDYAYENQCWLRDTCIYSLY